MAGRTGSGEGKRGLFQRDAMPHLGALYTAAFHLTRNRDDAQDLLQETVLRGYRFFHQFTPGTNCRAWLLTILYNSFRNGYRRAVREQPAATAEEYERCLETESLRAGPGRNDPESLAFDRTMDGEVEKALADLPEEFRTVLLMVDMQELSYDEAATVLKVPIGTVRSRLSRGRAMMRGRLRSFAKNKGYLRS